MTMPNTIDVAYGHYLDTIFFVFNMSYRHICFSHKYQDQTYSLISCILRTLSFYLQFGLHLYICTNGIEASYAFVKSSITFLPNQCVGDSNSSSP